MSTESLGRHLLIEFYECQLEKISDLEWVRQSLLEAARISGATIVTDVFHRFNPHGLSGVVVIAESHLAVHTWPEHLCVAVDIFSCGHSMQPELIEGFLSRAFGATRSECQEIRRGVIQSPNRPFVAL